jgi:NO-binding membrane sensor protein with MHYT domain
MMIHGSHESMFVLLSIVIAIATAYAALNLAGRATEARGRVRVGWILGGAVAMGIGINGMHFVGMLGYHLPLPVLYHVPTVLAALLAAILASCVALYVVSRPELSPTHALIGSMVMGGGIVTMHYTGMAAMRVAADAHYDPFLVALSVVIAVSVSLVGLWLVFHLRDPSTSAWGWRMGGAVIMGVAIPSMHYVAMMAVEYTPVAELPQVLHAIHISSLGVLLIVAALSIVLSLAVITSVLDRHLNAQATALAASEERFSAVAETAADAIVSADYQGHIIYFNPAAEGIFGYAAHEVQGRSLTLLMPERFHVAHQQGMGRIGRKEKRRSRVPPGTFSSNLEVSR